MKGYATRSGVDLSTTNHMIVAKKYTANATISLIFDRLLMRPVTENSRLPAASLKSICPADSANTVNKVKASWYSDIEISTVCSFWICTIYDV